MIWDEQVWHSLKSRGASRWGGGTERKGQTWRPSIRIERGENWRQPWEGLVFRAGQEM